MLPNIIVELIVELRKRTEQGHIKWDYSNFDDGLRASLSAPKIDICISYNFDTINEVGVFRVDIFDHNTQRPGNFSTTEEYKDFNLVRALYDSAQASGFKFSF